MGTETKINLNFEATAPEGPIRQRYIKFVYTGELDKEAKYREVMFEGDFGVGKTRALFDSIAQTIGRFEMAQLALLRDTRKNLEESTLPIFRRLFADAFRAGIFRYSASEDKVYLPNGCELYLFGLDVPEAEDMLKSSEFFRIFVDQAETVPEDKWELAMARTRQKCYEIETGLLGYNYIKGAANWDKGENWIYERFEKHASKIGHGMYETVIEDRELGITARRLLLQGTAKENHSLQESYFEAIALMSDTTRAKYFGGGRVQKAGRVFQNYDGRIHEVASIELPGSFPIYIGIDWGVNKRHKCYIVAAYLDDNGCLNIFDEAEYEQTPAEDVANDWCNHMSVMTASGHTQFYIRMDRSIWNRERDLLSPADDFRRVFSAFFANRGKQYKWSMQAGSANIETRIEAIYKRLKLVDGRYQRMVVSKLGAPKCCNMFRNITYEDIKKDTPGLVDTFDGAGYMIEAAPDTYVDQEEQRAIETVRRLKWR